MDCEVISSIDRYVVLIGTCLTLTACGGGEQPNSPSLADPKGASFSQSNGARHPTAITIESDQDTHNELLSWEARAAINREEVEQPSGDPSARQGTSDTKAALLGARAKAISAPATAIYRFFNNQTGSHLYTRSSTERDTILNTLAQYRYEGPVFGAWQSSSSGLYPVYRFANRANGTHFYTISESEKNNILATAPFMSLEGPAYYASKTAQAGTTPLYRFYHLQKGFHFYTANATEKDTIIANLPTVYQYEGVGYYVNASIGASSPALASFAGKVNVKGNVNAQGESARFGHILGMSFDSAGTLYLVDRSGDGSWYNSAEIRRISPSGQVTHFAGNWNTNVDYSNGVGSGISFYGLAALTFAPNNTLYFGDVRTVRLINSSVASSTIAGSLGQSGYTNGQAEAARFLGVRGIARDSAGNIYVSECFNAAAYPSSRIRKITPIGVVSTFAGAPTEFNNRGFADGQGTDARFKCPGQIDTDAQDNLYVADEENHRVRKITPSGLVTTLAGQAAYGVVNGQGSAAQFDRPFALAVDKNTGNVYVADYRGYTVRKITPSGDVSTVVGTAYNAGVFFGSLPAGLDSVGGLAIRGNRLYIASNHGVYWTNLPQ
ncbi:MAG TPA: hypothetical protein VIN35_14610 [Hydrogenophaga sp.]